MLADIGTDKQSELTKFLTMFQANIDVKKHCEL